jgi:hypothetical protein
VIGESPPGESILRWSSDGPYLLVAAGTGGTTVVSRLDTRTGARTPLRTVVTPAGLGTWSPFLCITPDGRSYAYTHIGRLDDLFVVDGLK